ncbi:MAG: MMPL family transporter [Candidatus Omnitrophica bacterium]|nr:MMPL family transporter [Candidatus Omnitrophota bacterium]
MIENPVSSRGFRIKKKIFSWETCVFVLLTLLTVTVITRYIDFTPHVDYDFFFSNEDAHYQADTNISKVFTRKDSQIIVSIRGNIYSKEYANKIEYLTSIIKTFQNVTGVKSITDGPSDLKDALESPFWSRLLIADNKESTNIVVIVQGSPDNSVINKIENLANVMDESDFHIKISGFPYIVEQIQKQLQKDLTKFTILSFILFALVVVFIFRSWRIFLGIIVTCCNASAMTFMISDLLHLKVGLLTANLATITFVLTLSQIIFLTYNWKRIRNAPNPEARVNEAIRITCIASFWCMLTTLLGFLSLMSVPAKPLRELGISGSITTLLSFITVYSIFPSFLRIIETTHISADESVNNLMQWGFHIVEKIKLLLMVAVLGTIALTIPKLWVLNTDPSLLTYFSRHSDIHDGLLYIDKNGGSSPLVIVVQDKDGQTLDSNKIYQRLWDLQQELERSADVGTILSLPTLMAEGKRLPLSFLLNWNWFFRALEQPEYDHIAKSFISSDRKSGLFLLRMREVDRSRSRLEVIKNLGTIIDKHGFSPSLVGGIYALQGHLSLLIADSLVYSLGKLIGIFALIAFAFGRSIRISLAMTTAIGIIPLFILGIIGYFQIPLDTIAAPATNVAIGMGIDSMIHMVNIFHLSKHVTSNSTRWAHVSREMWQPIMTSTLIICAGFGIFFFSSFPPTQRFGGTIVFGTLVSAFSSIFIFPLLARSNKKGV